MIKHDMPGVIRHPAGLAPEIPVDVEFCYDPEDPLAVEMTFQYEDADFGATVVVWTVARELLMRGSVQTVPYGKGDVRVRQTSPHAILLCLRSLGGHAHIRLPREPVIRFLNETQDAVRLGDECMDEAIDRAIEELLS